MKKNVVFYNFASYYNRIQNKNPSITDTILSGLSGSNTPPPGGMMPPKDRDGTFVHCVWVRKDILWGCDFKKEVLREKISALFVGREYDF